MDGPALTPEERAPEEDGEPIPAPEFEEVPGPGGPPARTPVPAEGADSLTPVPDLPPPPSYDSADEEGRPALENGPRRLRRDEPVEEQISIEEPAFDQGAPVGRFPEPPPLAVVSVEAEDKLAPEEPSLENDVLFGELARFERFVTEEQVAEALRISQRLRAEGRPKKLGKIMVKLGYLTATQAKYLLRLQRTPDPIDGYKLLERRGQGGMGVVYRALQKSMKREVALKILAPRFAQNARFLQRFVREAKLAATLNHPNIVGAIDVGESNEFHYYVMEYVDGWSVAEILREDGAFEEAEALDIVVQVAKALQHASEHQIVHRDVKPENILVTPDGVAKLADLGLSKRMTADCSITTEGKTLGTPFYVSPELARGARDVDIRSDIYSLGATLYHMLVGEPPFAGDNPATVMARHIAEEPVPVKRRRRDVSLATSRLVEKMMAKDPAKRYQSAEELIRDLVVIRRGKNPFGAVQPAEAGPTRLQAPRGRRTMGPGERPAQGVFASRGAVFAAAGALVFAAIVVGLVALAVVRRERGVGPRSSASDLAAAQPAVALAEREALARSRIAAAKREVELRLEEGRYDDARAAVDRVTSEVAGTPCEALVRDLREDVAREIRRVTELALRSARHALEIGRPDLALDHLRGAPECDAAEIVVERARLKAEAEKAQRSR